VWVRGYWSSENPLFLYWSMNWKKVDQHIPSPVGLLNVDVFKIWKTVCDQDFGSVTVVN
jgi:hypothetical protein